MFENLFRREIEIDIFSPASGEILSIEETPDDVFARKIVGDGFVIRPDDNKIYSPVAGEVKVVFPTLNSVAIETREGLEVLIHVGINTVELEGRGFSSFVEPGEKVERGQLLVSFDKEIIKEKAESIVTPIVFTNMEIVDLVDIKYGRYKKGDRLGLVKLK